MKGALYVLAVVSFWIKIKNQERPRPVGNFTVRVGTESLILINL